MGEETNKNSPWLSQFNRREQAKTSTRTNIKGICIEERRDQLSMKHEKAALHMAFSAQGYSSKKSYIKDGLRCGENDAKKDVTIVIL